MNEPVQKLFNDYFDACYKGIAVSKNQYSEVKRAFFSGCLAIIAECSDVTAKQGEGAAFELLKDCRAELNLYGKSRVAEMDNGARSN